MDDDRELRITSGAVIGVIMSLVAMLPRDIRRDFVSRLNEMTLAQEQEERNQVMVANDAPENDDMGQATTAVKSLMTLLYSNLMENCPDCLKRNELDFCDT